MQLGIIANRKRNMSYGYFDFRITYQTAKKIAMCEAQNWKCCYCKFTVELIPGETDSQNAATFEHIKPISRGGTDANSNLVIACQLCNHVRGSGNHEQFECVVLELHKHPLIRAAWHKFDDRHVDLFRKEFRFYRGFERINKGKKSDVRAAPKVLAQHRALVNLVLEGIV